VRHSVCCICMLSVFNLLPFFFADNILHIKTICYRCTVVPLSFYVSITDPFSAKPLHIYCSSASHNDWYIFAICLLLPLHFLMFKLVTILILEHACLLYASLSRPSLEWALVNSISQYQASDTHSAVMRQFTAPQEYSVSQFVEFILEHRL
jgi:hypothetical protein